MSLDCQLGIVAMWGEWEGFVKWLVECCRVEVWEQNRVLAGFGIGGKIGKRETPKVLMQAWDKFLEIKHACKEKQHQSEEVQELLNKLLQDLQSLNEELAEFINTPSQNLPTLSYDDDDDEYSFVTQEYLMTCSTAITPDSPKTDSLIMEDEHLDTMLKFEMAHSPNI
ncbi:hypothetical protein Tco_0630289 [Tanacetum coccineum]